MLLRGFIRSARFALPFAALVGCSPPARPAPDLRPQQAAFRAQFLRELDSMQLERLYVLDPYGATDGPTTPAPGHFMNLNVVRSAEPAPEDRQGGRAHRGLRNILEATTTTGVSCVDFVHGATFRGARGTYDVLVSIGCGNYRIYGQSKDDGVGDAFAGAETKAWYAAFEAARLIKKAH